MVFGNRVTPEYLAPRANGTRSPSAEARWEYHFVNPMVANVLSTIVDMVQWVPAGAADVAVQTLVEI
ncbi:unnamed protein product [Parascedosporium putredinis]|uniref:Uncharacterized protein n=1 Tax=Parascedosporium putredinis TaxID=1442378 RepID=A0A9P1H704_9PEZI|nr:unnamed protein product [Parascedosporium putredinis]CAI7999365.1 unnamed protein product [Parascedosporium putredinis]